MQYSLLTNLAVNYAWNDLKTNVIIMTSSIKTDIFIKTLVMLVFGTIQKVNLWTNNLSSYSEFV